MHDQCQDDDQYQDKQFAFVCHNYLRFKTTGINTAANLQSQTRCQPRLSLDLRPTREKALDPLIHIGKF